MPSDTQPGFLEPLLGIVFDLDGTLVLSHHDFGRMRREVIRTAEKYGVIPGHLSVEEPIHRLIERAREEMVANGVPDGQMFRFDASVHELIDAIELEAIPRTVARSGADAMLAALTERGFRLGLLTRSSETFCREALQRTELARYFSYLRTRSSPGPSKPSPEALDRLLKQMEIPRDRALYVGDHLIDAECARAAHVRFYAVLPDPAEPSSMNSDRFQAAGVAAIAKDLPELARMLDVARPPPPGASAR
jgi:phosphoglycolate phosphatase-like HAD superfamily hydrolase